MRRRTWTTALAIWLSSVVAMVAVGSVVGLSGQARPAQALLDFSFPVRDEWSDLVAVLWRNTALSAAALVLARARVGVGATSVLWALNVGLAGIAIGAYGERLIRHAAVYGLLELAGFAVVLATCLRVRHEGGRVRGGEVFATSALLVMAAVTETVWAQTL